MLCRVFLFYVTLIFYKNIDHKIVLWYRLIINRNHTILHTILHCYYTIKYAISPRNRIGCRMRICTVLYLTILHKVLRWYNISWSILHVILTLHGMQICIKCYITHDKKLECMAWLGSGDLIATEVRFNNSPIATRDRGKLKGLSHNLTW